MSSGKKPKKSFSDNCLAAMSMLNQSGPVDLFEKGNGNHEKDSSENSVIQEQPMETVNEATSTGSVTKSQTPTETHNVETVPTMVKPSEQTFFHQKPLDLAPYQQETKSKRLNLLIKPSLLSRVKNIAEQKQISVNDLINRLLENFLDNTQE